MVNVISAFAMPEFATVAPQWASPQKDVGAEGVAGKEKLGRLSTTRSPSLRANGAMNANVMEVDAEVYGSPKVSMDDGRAVMAGEVPIDAAGITYSPAHVLVGESASVACGGSVMP